MTAVPATLSTPSPPPDMPPAMTLIIDGQPVAARAGQTIWEAARDAGIDIPVLCHTPRMRPVGVCRMCAVDVGGRTLAAACVRAAEPGMTVETRSERVERSRRVLIELLMSDHQAPCARERSTGDCELEALARGYGVLPVDGLLLSLARGNGRPRDLSSPVIAVDHQACILCDLCIRACDDVQVNEVIGRTGKGYTTRIGFDLDNPMGDSTCVSCGECVAACPTGAITNKTITLPLIAKEELTAVDSV